MATRRQKGRGLVVLADGAQAAFAAGAVAEQARTGRVWSVGRGAGLGAQIAVLAVTGEAEEAERRWRRQAEGGIPLLASTIASARARLGDRNGALVVPDAYTLPGWLDAATLDEYLAPELAGLAHRLVKASARCAVAVQDLPSGALRWIELAEATTEMSADAMRAAARFPAGWGAVESDAGAGLWWGGAALVAAGDEWLDGAAEWDVVCGFPVPPVARPSLGTSLLELVQRREEILAGTAIAASASTRGVRLIAPTEESYARWAARDGASLGVEYPLPWERNAELAGLLVDYGRAVARSSS